MRPIKYRQYIAEFKYWHYWGFMPDGSFTSPVNLHDPSDQFIGLHDKTGKEIYEADVVYIAGFGKCLVKWDKFDLCFLFERIGFNETYYYQDVIEDLEYVIGNCYENPELLKIEFVKFTGQ